MHGMSGMVGPLVVGKVLTAGLALAAVLPRRSTTGDGSNDAPAGAKGSVSSGSGKQNGKRPAAGTAAGANKKQMMELC